ncbi:hypothetical protein DSECCO2_580690 [anaerobic digester metagenome]
MHGHHEGGRHALTDGVHVDLPEDGLHDQPDKPPGDPVSSHPVPLLLCGEVFLVDIVSGRKRRDQKPEESDGGGDPVEGEFPEGRVEPERHRLIKRHREQPGFCESKRRYTRRQHAGGKHINGDGLEKDADCVTKPEREVHTGPDPIPGKPVGEERGDDDPKEEEVGEDRPPVEVKYIQREVGEERYDGHHTAGCKRRPRREEDERKERERPGQVLVAHTLVTEVEESGNHDDPGASDVQICKGDMGKHGKCYDGGTAHVPDSLDG